MTSAQPAQSERIDTDVVLIGGGIMSATLGAYLKRLQPQWDIQLFERLDAPGLESSDPWNNAGTGHAALCELNYTPAAKDGSVSPDKAISINEQFQITRQFLSYFVDNKLIGDPKSFINPVPHMSFVWGADHSAYLKTRYDALKPQPLFDTIEFTQDRDQIGQWAPLMVAGRDAGQEIAASRVAGGTDVDFGSLTRQLTEYLKNDGATLHFRHDVTNLSRTSSGAGGTGSGGTGSGGSGGWEVTVKDLETGKTKHVSARFVFIGAGGGALHLLQKSGIPEGKGFGGFPISGQFLRCTDPAIVDQHLAKAYGQASVGAPPMSVPHLDTRYVGGKRSLLFGPYAGFSTKYLKKGSYLDLPGSVRVNNIYPMLAVGAQNLGLVKYLVSEVLKSRSAKDDTLRTFFPEADGADWELITAGQRVQVMKKDAKKGGILQFGTELITAGDGSIAALLGASPGASTAAPIMIELLKRCFPEQFAGWEDKLREIVPSYGQKLNDNPDLLAEVTARTNASLKLA